MMKTFIFGIIAVMMLQSCGSLQMTGNQNRNIMAFSDNELPAETVVIDSEQVIAKKRANAIIQGAQINGLGKAALNAAGGSGTSTIFSLISQKMGGTSVGGSVKLYSDRVEFKPNRLDALMIEGKIHVIIPLSDVTEVNVRDGFLTHYVDVITAYGKLVVRCFGAQVFAEKIRDQVRLVNR